MARLEENTHNANQAIGWLERLKKVVSDPQAVQRWMDNLKRQKGP
jgi:hypothetical protein